jgi:hypothetical protein
MTKPQHNTPFYGRLRPEYFSSDALLGRRNLEGSGASAGSGGMRKTPHIFPGVAQGPEGGGDFGPFSIRILTRRESSGEKRDVRRHEKGGMKT